MKTDIELLKLLRDKLPEYIPEDTLGMCGVIYLLWVYRRVSHYERIRLNDLLIDVKPKQAETYWFPKGKLY